jgi:hypothetical protein
MRYLQQGEQSMTRRLMVLVVLSIIVIGLSASFQPTQSAIPQPCAPDHEAWLAQIFEKMESIKPGMTRAALLQIYRTEGGRRRGLPPARLPRTFVNRDGPQFRIDVEFKSVAEPDDVNPSFATSVEDNRDIIVKMSKPYLQFAAAN